MNARWLAVLSSLLALSSSPACRPAVPTASCAIHEGHTLDVSGRANGVYAGSAARIAHQPLMRFDQMTRTGRGVDPSGKPWLRMTLDAHAARALQALSRDPVRRSITVIVDGQVAAHHGLREPIVGAEIQVSCCDASACDRWAELVANVSHR